MPPKTESFEMRFNPEMLSRIDQWRRDQPDIPPRAESIRRLLEQALAGAKPKGRRTAAATESASAMAGRAIDRLADTAAPAKEQASRRKRLLHGPKEFRKMRAKSREPKRP
jgi:hypothetical protein